MPTTSNSAPRIPGVAGVEHIGLTVPSVEAASGFLHALLGAATLYDIGPFAEPGEWMATHLASTPGSRIHRLRVVRIANGPVLELIELERGATGATPSAAAGGFHIAFYVEDMEAALSALKVHGAEIQTGPVEMTQGPSAGLTFLYFKAPWGQQLELVSYPGGIAAYREKHLEVWRPRS